MPVRRVGLFQHVAPGANRPDGEAERRQAAAEPEHVHVEDVATGGAPGPHGPAQRVAAHDGAEALDEGVGQAGFDRGERHPARAEAEDAVAVDLRHGAEVGPAPGLQTVDPGPDVRFGSRQADPILQAVERLGWGDAVVDQQQPGEVPFREADALLRLAGPPDQHDVHERKR